MKNRRDSISGVPYGTLLKVFVFCALVGGAGVGYVWQQQQVYELGKETVLAERRLADQRRQNEKLLRTWATLQSPRMLEEQVKRLNLGLGPPSPEQVWHVSEPAVEVGPAVAGKPSGDRLALAARLKGAP
jgi:hypothetical protein